MKNLIFLFLTALSSCTATQKNEQYLIVDFSSICCGTPTEKPLLDHVKKFKKEKKLQNVDIWRESGLGREGEFALFISLDGLKKSQQAELINGIKLLSENFSKKRNNNSDGYINISEELISKIDLMKKKEKKTNTFYNFEQIKY